MECGTWTNKIVWYGVLVAIISNSSVSGVTFSTSTTGSGFTDDDSNGNTFTWAAGTTIAVTITTDSFAVSGAVTPVVTLRLDDGTSPISCILNVGDSTCSVFSCTAGIVTCTKGNPSGILTVQFTLNAIPVTYNAAIITFTLSASTVGPWDYGTKQLAVSGCPLTYFEGAEVSAVSSQTCGLNCVAIFTCPNRERHTCGEFTRTCQANTQWDEMSAGCTLCSETCSLELGTKIGISFAVIHVVLLIIWTVLIIKYVAIDNGEMYWLDPVAGASGWVLYFITWPLLITTKPVCCCFELTGQGIGGTCVGSINTIIILIALACRLCKVLKCPSICPDPTPQPPQPQPPQPQPPQPQPPQPQPSPPTPQPPTPPEPIPDGRVSETGE